MTPGSEFSRTVRIDTIGASPRNLSIGANEAERAALASRFGLVALDRLDADLALTRSGEEVTAEGRVRAAVTQSCVATAVPLPAEIDEPFTILFRPERENSCGDEEIELSEAEMDVVFYSGALIDVGEAVAETLALALDQWPRAPDADEALKEAGVKSEEQAKAESSPFAALKDKLKS